MGRRGPSSPRGAPTTWRSTPPTSSSGHCCSGRCYWAPSFSQAQPVPALTLATLDTLDTSRDRTIRGIMTTIGSADRTMVRGHGMK